VALFDLLQQAALFPAADLEAESVVRRLTFGEFAGSGPFDVAEVAVQDGQPVADLGVGGELDNVVEHDLAVLPGAGVDEDNVCVGKVGRGWGFRLDE
jgi:hypothetical protein